MIGPRRIDGFVRLLRLAEAAGQVVTIRDLIIAVALAITGGLDCEGVHARFSRSRNDTSWEHDHLFHEILFEGALAASRRSQSPLLKKLLRLDPGKVAAREVDDFLEPLANESQGYFLPPEPSTRDHRVQDRKTHLKQKAVLCRQIAFLRRRDFFDRCAAPSVDLGRRLGFKFADEFLKAASGTLEAGMKVAIRDSLLRGLEAVQGIRRTTGATFFVVDPSFTTGRGRASVVSRTILNRDVNLLTQEEWWEAQPGGSTECARVVDWNNRCIYITFEKAGAVALELDLLRFELVLRYGEGLTARSHFQTELHRINSQLARLAVDNSDDHKVTVLVDGEKCDLVIDVDGRIRVGGD